MSNLRDGLTLACIASLLLAGTAEPGPVCIAGKSGPPVVVAALSQDALLQSTAGWCRDFLKQRGYQVSPQQTPAGTHTGPVWLLRLSAEADKAAAAFLKKSRADAYVLRAATDSGHPSVSVTANTPQGVRSGVARLVAIMNEQDGGVYVPETTEMREPFYTGRRLNLSYEWPSWDEARVRRLLEAAWLLGYNSVEFPYLKIGLRDKPQAEVDADLAKDRETYRRFMQIARQNGLQVSQVIYGQSFFFFGRMNEGNLGALCWYKPEDRALIEKQFQWMASNLGDLIDNVTVHVSDPGGCDCDGCDPYVTCQEVAAVIRREYRAVNPRVTVTLSTWAHPRFWSGHAGDRLLDDKYMPRDIGIALHRWYNRDLAALVRASGRPVDIWGWYLGDYEGEWDFFLNMSTIARYYSALPAEASRDVRTMTQELCFPSKPQIINTYVAGQKMWSPKRSLKTIEHEFCAGVFGDRNADAVVKVYEACERYVHPGRYDFFIPPTDCPPEVIGTPEYNRQLRDALEAAKSVDLAIAPLQRIPTPTDRKDLYERLVGHLNIILIGSEALEKIDVAKKSGASQAELQGIVDEAMAAARPYESTQIDWAPSDYHIKWGHTSLSQRVKDAIKLPAAAAAE